MAMKTRTTLTLATIACLTCISANALAQQYGGVQPATMAQWAPSNGGPQYSNDPFVESPPMAVASPSGGIASPAAIPADARRIAVQYGAEKAAVRLNARRQIRKLRQTLVASLETLQTGYAHDVKLDEAVAIRDCIRGLGGLQPKPDPGMLFAYGNSIGRALFFRVTGDSKKPIWGTNPYTPDSALSSAAVHAGVLKAGQTGVVKVTMLPGQSSYRGSKRNGITSSKWGNSPVSYLVQPVTEKDEDAEEMSPAMRSVSSPGMPYSAPVRSYSYGASGVPGGYSPAARPEWIVVRQNPFVASPAVTAPTVKLPADAQRLVDDFQAASAAIHKASNRKIAELRRTAVGNLKPLQDKYTRETRLDEAIAIRDYIGEIKQPVENILPDPGAMSAFQATIGSVFHFRVTGRRGGVVWGAGVYTADSALAATAVHAGALREGQTGIVKVTILPGQPSYESAVRNGIASNAFGPYPTSYRVEPANVDDSVAADEESKRTPPPTATTPQVEKKWVKQVEDLRREVGRLERSLHEVITQLNQIREEEQMLKKQPPAR
jgi:hypothetical protein